MNEVIRPNLLLSLFTTFTYKRIITLNFKEVLLQLLNHFLEVYLFCLHTVLQSKHMFTENCNMVS